MGFHDDLFILVTLLLLKVRKLIKNNAQFRYLFSGCFFTILGPSLFLLISFSLSVHLSIIISEFCLHSLRFFVITRWIFKYKINKKSLRSYLKASIPLSALNFILVSFLSMFIEKVFVAIIIGLFSATIGFLWTRYSYKTSSDKNNY